MKPTAVYIAAGVAILGAAALAAGSDYFLSASQSTPGTAAAKPERTAAEATASRVTPTPMNVNLQTTKMKVSGMWCGSCGYMVKKALMSNPGVVDAKVSVRAGTAVVTYDPSRCSAEQLMASTAQYGFSAAVLTR